MASSKNALQSFWERMFQDYTKHVKYLQTQNPTWEQMVELERYRQALLDFRFNGKCSKRREGIRMKEMQEYMESQKTNLKRKLSHGKVVRALNFNSSASDRLKELARSRTNPPQCGAKPWKLTSAMRSFEPSERLLSLACHRTPFREPRNPFKVSSSALIYEATPRILRLAELNKKNVNRHQRGPSKPYWFGPTHRIWELAKPRVREDGIYRKTPFKVAEGALRAKASPRVLQLAEPRM
nr:uncharacterized protein LOC108073554 isoform X2 [Drosophila kikkawai]